MSAFREKKKTESVNSEASCCCSAEPVKKEESKLKPYYPAIFSFVLLAIGLALDQYELIFFNKWVRLAWYLVAYIPVGWPVIKQGLKHIQKGEFFTEFFLMALATLGAFAIGEYPEGVAVMLFYTIGELFQHAAVYKAKNNIKALLDMRPKSATVFRNGEYVAVDPETISVGEKIRVNVGAQIPLDGKLISKKASLNTAAITGESKPDNIQQGNKVYAGSINMEGVVEIEVTKIFKNSSIARIMEMVQNATSRKSKTELFIRKFAKIYTPIVFYLALALTFLPYFFVENYIFQDWLYRALIFLVVSCPCALVISIPLGYFGGLGAGSKNGILFKGASFLDAITKIDTVVMDKTGTLTKGVFKVKDIESDSLPEKELMQYVTALEVQSTHPIAKAIAAYWLAGTSYKAEDVTEIPGKGLQGTVNGKKVLAGNQMLMTVNNISIPNKIENIPEAMVIVAIDNKYAGYITIADELKEDALQSISQMKKHGIKQVVILSGDKQSITTAIGQELGVDIAKGGLLPEDKLNEVEKLKKNTKLAFMGDGINDAPVLAIADVGVAMGGLGSDVAIETADVVIQTDQPSKLPKAIQIGKSTRKIIWQNIALAFGVKLIVLVMGAGGLATMWEAVFADVGVALLAILNAIRLQRMKWE
ncbi:heavy metal translocating P-type ATPase [Galbibacter sp. EGI 63066]|uniref:heavy metal translocating P-type ATPase n=1 Tax=Galbibacter sp. EGI 63066 TaxID=2993559 RepID=UPI002249674B|nr:heavy metal translocating P-type ATPase [Galbibacter sp. EGI 63066]MCX2681727.1 heavy metal translocating P-type ATPase [Galbibacter sp. EGI 63066]